MTTVDANRHEVTPGTLVRFDVSTPALRAGLVAWLARVESSEAAKEVEARLASIPGAGELRLPAR